MNAPLAPERTLGGPKELLMGPSGRGKTYALGTAVDWAARNGIECCALFTSNGLETLLGYWRDSGKPVPSNLHYHQATTRPIGLKGLVAAADTVGKLSYEAITKMVDPNRGGENNAYWKILKACSDFTCDHCGKKLGAVDEWKTDKMFILDDLTELSNAAMKMQIGNKPTASQPDYGVAQNNLMNFLRLLTQGCECTVIMTAHVDRETDPITQSTSVMVKAIGKALAPEIPALFSDVIYAVREGDKFYWDTAAYGVDTKTRSLGYKSKIDPSFAQIFDLWLKRAGKEPAK